MPNNIINCYIYIPTQQKWYIIKKEKSYTSFEKRKKKNWICNQNLKLYSLSYVIMIFKSTMCCSYCITVILRATKLHARYLRLLRNNQDCQCSCRTVWQSKKTHSHSCLSTMINMTSFLFCFFSLSFDDANSSNEDFLFNNYKNRIKHGKKLLKLWGKKNSQFLFYYSLSYFFSPQHPFVFSSASSLILLENCLIWRWKEKSFTRTDQKKG